MADFRDELYFIRPDRIMTPDQGVEGMDLSADWRGRPLVVFEQDGMFFSMTGSNRVQGAIDDGLPSVPAFLVPWDDICENVWVTTGSEADPDELQVDDHGLGRIAAVLRRAGYELSAQVLEDESAMSPRNYSVVYSREGDRAWIKTWFVPGRDAVAMRADLRGEALAPAEIFLQEVLSNPPDPKRRVG